MAEEPRTTLTDGRQVYPEHRKLKPNGQQQDYVVLAEEERAKGFVRPEAVLRGEHYNAHKVMTPEEYAGMPLIGWHEVCRDVDGCGAVGVRFLSSPLNPADDTPH